MVRAVARLEQELASLPIDRDVAAVPDLRSGWTDHVPYLGLIPNFVSKYLRQYANSPKKVSKITKNIKI